MVCEVYKFCLMNSTGACRQQCAIGGGSDARGQIGDCQVAERASMSIGIALVTHSVLASHELLASWVLGDWSQSRMGLISHSGSAT
jgi:hypothetical protein